ncbi:MAG: hypothetical protein NXI01_04930 [Gammaproteobacteria bacterium]|nr:hypothetical protein [Gammaproteobacteria bacterium]
MKRLGMLALAGVMAVGLGACGESTPPKPDVNQPDMAIEQNQDNSAQPAAPTAPPSATSEEMPAATTNTEGAPPPPPTATE